jgi:hypothetical protein
MNPSPESSNLLNDVFADATPAEFSAAVLECSVRQARRRKTTGNAVRWGGATTLAVVTLAFVARLLFGGPVHRRQGTAAFNLVATQSLPAASVVRTRPFHSAVAIPSGATVAVVRNRPGAFRMIGDQELLDLLSPAPAMLVQIGPQRKELVFPKPEDDGL